MGSGGMGSGGMGAGGMGAGGMGVGGMGSDGMGSGGMGAGGMGSGRMGSGRMGSGVMGSGGMGSGGKGSGGLLSGRSQFGGGSGAISGEPIYTDNGFSLAAGRGNGGGMVGQAGGGLVGGGCGQFGCGNNGRLCLGCRLKNAFGGGRHGANGGPVGQLRGAVSGMGIQGQHPYGGQIPHTDYMGAGVTPQAGYAPTVAYPYYTTRGPRDFLQKNPPSIGW